MYLRFVYFLTLIPYRVYQHKLLVQLITVVQQCYLLMLAIVVAKESQNLQILIFYDLLNLMLILVFYTGAIYICR